MDKHLFRSKTFWANLVIIPTTIAGLFGLDIDITPDQKVAIGTCISTVVNIFLRLISTEKVYLKR